MHNEMPRHESEWMTVYDNVTLYPLDGQGGVTSNLTESNVGPTERVVVTGFYVDTLTAVAPTVRIGPQTFKLQVAERPRLGSYQFPGGGLPILGPPGALTDAAGTQVKVFYRRVS